MSIHQLLENSYYAAFCTATYVKLSQAYFSETNKLGGWTLIGYKAPGEDAKTTNFEYKGAINANTAVTATTPKAWSATNNLKLNDCASAEHWTIEAVYSATNDTYNAAIASDNDGACTALTPSFTLIGK